MTTPTPNRGARSPHPLSAVAKQIIMISYAAKSRLTEAKIPRRVIFILTPLSREVLPVSERLNVFMLLDIAITN